MRMEHGFDGSRADSGGHMHSCVTTACLNTPTHRRSTGTGRQGRGRRNWALPGCRPSRSRRWCSTGWWRGTCPEPCTSGSLQPQRRAASEEGGCAPGELTGSQMHLQAWRLPRQPKPLTAAADALAAGAGAARAAAPAAAAAVGGGRQQVALAAVAAQAVAVCHPLASRRGVALAGISGAGFSDCGHALLPGHAPVVAGAAVAHAGKGPVGNRPAQGALALGAVSRSDARATLGLASRGVAGQQGAAAPPHCRHEVGGGSVSGHAAAGVRMRKAAGGVIRAVHTESKGQYNSL